MLDKVWVILFKPQDIKQDHILSSKFYVSEFQAKQALKEIPKKYHELYSINELERCEIL